MSFPRKTLSLIPLAAVGALTLAAQPARASNPVQVVLTGLNNPFGLAFGPDGGLYVADAGTGGLSTSPGFVDGNHNQVYFGDTGDVTEYLPGVQPKQVITGLPSLGAPGGTEATGLQGITFVGNTLYGVFGLGTDPNDPTKLASVISQLPSGSNAADLGQLVDLTTNTPVSNVAGYETPANYSANNPDFSPHNPGDNAIEANPYGLTALAGGGFAVTDGGGNVALKVAAGGGAPTLLSQFLPMPNPLFPGKGGPVYQSVPTGIAQGPNGNLFVGEFTGYPFPIGGANVFRVNPTTGTSKLVASGFTNITGLTFGPGRRPLRVGQHHHRPCRATQPWPDIPGGPDNRRENTADRPAPGSTYAGLAAGPDDALYLSSQGNGAPGAGQVLRYSLAPCRSRPRSPCSSWACCPSACSPPVSAARPPDVHSG